MNGAPLTFSRHLTSAEVPALIQVEGESGRIHTCSMVATYSVSHLSHRTHRVLMASRAVRLAVVRPTSLDESQAASPREHHSAQSTRYLPPRTDLHGDR